MSYDIDKVTPRPWIVGGEGERGDIYSTRPESYRVAKTITCASAAHIVHCVNNHEALVEMLERLADRVEDECVDPDPEWHDSDQDVDDARALLATLKESTP